MAKKDIIGVAMLGMNRFSQADLDHPFDMSEFEQLPKQIHREVWDQYHDEVNRSTLFYEACKAVDRIRQSVGLDHNDIQLIFGRGRPGDGSETRLREALMGHSQLHGKNTFKFVVAKSYGAADAMEALQEINSDPRLRDVVAPIDLLVILDGTALRLALRGLLEEYEVDDREEKRFLIPTYVKKTYVVVQRVDRSPFRGYRGGYPGQPRVTNILLEPNDIDDRYRYSEYSDGYSRLLKVNHMNVEEIGKCQGSCRIGRSSCGFPFGVFLRIKDDTFNRIPIPGFS